MVLSDYANIKILKYEPLRIHYCKRIKILDEKAKGRADIIIPYYHSDGYDKINSMRAQTINVVNGKIEKTALKNKDFFKTKLDEHRSELKFSFPNIKVGSIIEYSYTLETGRYNNLKKWSFQTDIPTLYSQVNASIDSKFNYRVSYQGARLMKKYREGNYNSWMLTNLPAIKPEPFCLNEHDYIEQINFQLESYYNSSGFKEMVLKTWDEFAKDLINEQEFQKILKKVKEGKEIIAPIIKPNDSDHDKIRKIFDHVSSNYEWNEYVGVYPSKNFKTIVADKKGNAQDINLLLVLLMRSAGLDADPVLLSTKSHGFVSKSFTFTDQFNLLICNVHLDGKDILLDASLGKRPYDLLPVRNLNFLGFLIHENKSRWVEIPVRKKTRTVKLVNMKFENPEKIKYKLEVAAREYDAYNLRNELKNTDIKKYFFDNLVREAAEVSIDSVASKNLDEINKPVFITAYITDKNLCVTNDEFVYLNPFVDYFDATNLFSENIRYFPIDLIYPFERSYILNLTIPEKYEVLEYPEPLNLKLPEEKGFIKFASSLNNNNFQLRMTIMFKDHFFLPNEYPYLKELYDLYIEKRQEQIVLKKKT